MKRRLLTLTAAMSLVLYLATVGLWVRSYWRAESIAYIDDIDDGTLSSLTTEPKNRSAWSKAAWHDEWRLCSSRGLMWIYHNRSDTSFRSGVWRRKGWHYSTDDFYTSSWFLPQSGPLAWFGFGHFGRFSDQSMHPFVSWGRTRVVSFPHWALVVVAGIPPAFWFHRLRRERRRNQSGHCPTCGYDLRATPQRCPECGAAAAETPAR